MEFSLDNSSFQSTNQIDVNTDDIQKIILSEAAEAKEELAEYDKSQQILKPEKAPKNPTQKIIDGDTQVAKKELLKEFIEKVAQQGLDIFTHADKGKENVKMDELKIIFGQQALNSDEITISAQAQTAKLAGQLKSKSKKTTEQEEKLKDVTKKEEGFKNSVLTEKGDLRSSIQKQTNQNDDGTELGRKLNPEEEIKETPKGQQKQKGDTLDDGEGEKNKDKGEVPDTETDEAILAKAVREKINKEQEIESFLEGEYEVEDGGDADEEISDFDDDDSSKDNEIEKAAGGRIRTAGSNTGDNKDDEESLGRDEKGDLGNLRAINKLEGKPTKKEILIEYTQHYKEHLLAGSKNIFKLRQAEESLLKEYGITSKQLKDLQLSIKKNIKIEIRDKIKDAILNKQLSVMNKFDATATDAKINHFSNMFIDNILLGGTDFGNFDESFQGLINKSMYYAGKDLSNFAIQELEEFVIQTSLGQNDKVAKVKAFEQKINTLNAVTNNPKVTEEWAQVAMESFMKNYGLSKEKDFFPVTDKAGIAITIGDSGIGQRQQKKREEHGYEFDSDDEKSLLINRLRALYLKRALNPSMQKTLTTAFKIRKMRNGLLRLGVYTDILNEQLQKEAETIAQDRLEDMLQEALLERATLYNLKGAAYNLVEDKIKGILKNADSIGWVVDKTQFNRMRDTANRKVLETTKKQMQLIEVRLSDQDIPQLVVKYLEMRKLIDRLCEESGFNNEDTINQKFDNVTMTELA